MTTSNEHLDRAIEVADKVLNDIIDGFLLGDNQNLPSPEDAERIYARALIKELLQYPPTDETNLFQDRDETRSYRFVDGFAEIRRRAGLEGEG